jgi:hypothetical protein
MIAQLCIAFMLILFVVFMTIWVVRMEKRPKRKPDLNNPMKSYKKAVSRGLNFPKGGSSDALQGL